MTILGKQEVNTARQIEADIAKAVCIIGMILVHMYEEFLNPSITTVGFQNALLNVIQTLVGAPCFMVCMGLGISYTKKNEPSDLIKRGLFILGLGYLLNFLRWGISYIIYSIIYNYPASRYIYGFYYYIAQNDILQFAGLSLILIGILKKYKLNNIKILFVSIALSIVGSIVRMFSINDYLDFPIGLLLGTYNVVSDTIYAYFPLFNWFIFVVFGMVFGDILKRVENKNKFYGLIVPCSILIVSIYLIFAIPNSFGMINPNLVNYYHLTTFDVCFSIIACSGILGIYYFISLIIPAVIKTLITSISRNLNRIYCIHWIVIGNLELFTRTVLNWQHINSPTFCNLFGVGLFFVSYFLSLLIEVFINREH